MFREPSPRISCLHRHRIRQEQNEACSAERAVVDAQVSTLRLGGRSRDRQSEARTRAGAVVETLKLAKDALPHGWRNARTSVAHLHPQARWLHAPQARQ